MQSSLLSFGAHGYPGWTTATAVTQPPRVTFEETSATLSLTFNPSITAAARMQCTVNGGTGYALHCNYNERRPRNSMHCPPASSTAKAKAKEIANTTATTRVLLPVSSSAAAAPILSRNRLLRQLHHQYRVLQCSITRLQHY